MSNYVYVETQDDHARRFPDAPKAWSLDGWEGEGLYDLKTGAAMPRTQRLELAAPQVVRDGLPDMRSMADGKRYDSKRAYYRSLKRHGCEIVANDDPKNYVARKPTDREHMHDVAMDVKKARQQVASGNFDPSPVPTL